MKTHSFLLLLSLLLVTALSCKKDKDAQPVIRKQNLEITIQEQYETPPSRVSVFFKVEKQNGDPVAGLSEEHFTIYEKGRNDDNELLLSEHEATRTISDNRQVFRYHTMLVLDLSGSVLNGSLDQLKEASKKFIEDIFSTQINSSTSVGVWWFDGRDMLHSLIDFTDDKAALFEAIDSITPSISSDTSTDLFGAILKATSLAQAKLTQNDIQGIRSAAGIIVFTDGTDQAARYSKDDAYDAVDNAEDNINFYTIGLGNEIDAKVLERLGKSSSVFADDTAALTKKFKEIADLIFGEANSYYLFEYCTPKRDGSGISELHMHIETADAKGKKITTFDATGFEDDCDLN